jgi:hypothetical protein
MFSLFVMSFLKGIITVARLKKDKMIMFILSEFLIIDLTVREHIAVFKSQYFILFTPKYYLIPPFFIT